MNSCMRMLQPEGSHDQRQSTTRPQKGSQTDGCR